MRENCRHEALFQSVIQRQIEQQERKVRGGSGPLPDHLCGDRKNLSTIGELAVGQFLFDRSEEWRKRRSLCDGTHTIPGHPGRAQIFEGSGQRPRKTGTRRNRSQPTCFTSVQDAMNCSRDHRGERERCARQQLSAREHRRREPCGEAIESEALNAKAGSTVGDECVDELVRCNRMGDQHQDLPVAREGR